MSDEQHYLIVQPWVGDYDDVFEVEHNDSCPMVQIDPWAMEDGLPPVLTMGCLVGQHVDEAGLDEWFQHADDPARDEHHEHVPTGRHAIEAWDVCYRSYEGPDEYDSGLQLAETVTS